MVLFLILLLNLPFGFWRAGVQRYSPRWFVAVHAPVPLVIGLRVMLGVGWKFRLLPLFLAAYFAGQFLGGRSRSLVRARSKDQVPGSSEDL
jgi:hypothetical protein